MKRSWAIFLQALVVLIGMVVVGLMLWEPQIEGRNAHATSYQIYFNDPFLAYAYAASIPFFVALYQTFKLLEYARHNRIFSEAALSALRRIRYCGFAVAGFVVGGEAYLFLARRGEDDIAGGVVVGLGMILIALIGAAVAAILERFLKARLRTA